MRDALLDRIVDGLMAAAVLAANAAVGLGLINLPI
jgi:hypothetical protein